LADESSTATGAVRSRPVTEAKENRHEDCQFS
jgi:hypothetical protein